MSHANRPLSPHLGVYRWQVSNTLSILHRMSGVGLALGAVVLCSWLMALAAGPDAYLALLGVLRSPPGVLLLVAWSFCFFYHLCNGVRHLFWDGGYGFEIARSRTSGMAAVGVAVVLTVAFWVAALLGDGG